MLQCQESPGSLAGSSGTELIKEESRCVEECVWKEKWEALTQEGQRARKKRAASAPKAEPKSAETPQAIAKVIAKSARKKVKKTTTVTKPASRLQRRQPRTQPRPFSSSGCLGLKRTTPAPAATWVRDYIDATVREFAGTPETASRLGFSMGRTRWTKAGLREATMRESMADPASKRALMEKAQN